MIAKCIAVLAIVAQINAYGCNQQTVVIPSSGSCSQGSSVALLSSGLSGSSGAITRNLVAQGKYPVALSNCGPSAERQIPITTSQITAPTQEKPTIRLSSSIPAPRTVSHTCTCYKTIMRPRVNQQIITVPSLQRYIETTHKPVVENIQYEAEPVNCGSSSGSQVQLLQVPQVQTVQLPQVQTVQVPQVQTVQIPQVQTVQVPQVQTVQVPQVQTVQVPQFQTVQVPQVQTVEVPQVQSVQLPQIQTVQIPQVQSVQIPQSISFGSSSCSC